MNQIRKLLLGTALTTLAAAAFAQTPAPAGGSMNPQAPAAAGIDTPRQTPDIAGLRDEPPAPGATDPMAQKRDADARANAEYKQDKKAARSEYDGQVKSAKAHRKADRKAATEQMKDDMHGEPAQSQGSNPRP